MMADENLSCKIDEKVLAMARRIVDANGDGERDWAHSEYADQVAEELLRIAALLSGASNG